MPSNFGTTPLSTTSLGANQFPISAGFVPNTASGNLTSIQLGPATTDSNAYTSAPVATYTPDGNSLVEGATTDAAVTGDVVGSLSAKLRGLSKIFAQLQFDGSNFLKVNVSAGTVSASQSGTWNIANVSGTVSLPTGAATDATIAKLNIAQGAALGSNTGPIAQGSVTTGSPAYTTGNINPLSLTTAGALRVDASATTQPISATSLPLPTGASTAAKQPAPGTAGTASSDVITVQGIASMTALKVDASATTQPVSGNVTANAGTNLNTSLLALESGGNLASIKADADSLVTNTTGLATAANQSTGNTSLSTIATNTGRIPAQGAAATAASTPVNIASDQTVPIKRNTVAVYTLTSTTTSGATQNSTDLTVGPYSEVSIDITTTAQAGTNPTIQYFWERKGADGLYYPLWQSAVLTVAANTLSTSIGTGMAYNQSLGLTNRLRWVVGGTSTPTFTHSINVYGK